jgi:hypothetical protein
MANLTKIQTPVGCYAADHDRTEHFLASKKEIEIIRLAVWSEFGF